MTPRQLLTLAVDPALSLLPGRMDTPEARRMLVAIAIQESGLKYRQQVLRPGRHWWEWRGPANGLPMFEPTGLKGVLTHPASGHYAIGLAKTLGYDLPGNLMPVWLSHLHAALKHNDVLSMGMARLLLWTLPEKLPEYEQTGWRQYLEAWRPGKPDRVRWVHSWAVAREAIA